MNGRGLAVALLVAMTAPAPAAEKQEIGAQTRQWLELQRSNNAALGAPRPMPGEVADEVYQRYLKSFTNPIPDQFERGSFAAKP